MDKNEDLISNLCILFNVINKLLGVGIFEYICVEMVKVIQRVILSHVPKLIVQEMYHCA